MTSYLCLGANLGDPEAQIQAAIQALAAHPEISVLRLSALHKTAPCGKTDQPDFWNQVAEIETGLSPAGLLEAALQIETGLGRTRSEKWGPRTIDIDILLYEDEVIQSESLVLPHPELHKRLFALHPLAELVPHKLHPVLHKDIATLIQDLERGKENDMTSLTAIILAAGKGTRMKSARAKVTFPIAGKPMVQRVVNSAVKLDCAKLCVVVGYQKESVIGCLEEDERLEFVEQTEQLGTGHAVMMAEPAFQGYDQDVLILCGDVPLLKAETLAGMVAEHRSSGAACTVLTAFLDDPGKYGRILRDEAGQLTGIVEFKDATEAQRAIKEWNTGIYCFSAPKMFAALKQISNLNQQNEYYLTDAVAVLYQQGERISSVVLDNLTEVAGVNSQEQLAELEDQFVAEIRRNWLNSGVVIHNPNTVYIDDDVEIEPDVEIGQNCVLKGRSIIRAGSHLGPNCLVCDSCLCEDSLLEGHNILVNAHIPEGHIISFGERVIEEIEYD